MLENLTKRLPLIYQITLSVSKSCRDKYVG